MTASAENGLPELMARAEVWVAMESSSHLPEKDGVGCICGFCVWSSEHVAVMSFRDGVAAFLAHERAVPPDVGSGYCPDACTWAHDHRFERDGIPWPARTRVTSPGTGDTE